MKKNDDYRLFKHLIDWRPKIKEFEPYKYDGIYYPTKELIIDLHEFLLTCFEEEGDININQGIYSDGALNFTGIKYYEENIPNIYDNIINKAAHVFNLFLEEGHPFNDGNKRTGFVTLWIFLIMNNYHVRFDYYNYDRHIEKITKWADATQDCDRIEEISKWIYDNSTLYIKIRKHLSKCKNYIPSSFR